MITFWHSVVKSKWIQKPAYSVRNWASIFGLCASWTGGCNGARSHACPRRKSISDHRVCSWLLKVYRLDFNRNSCSWCTRYYDSLHSVLL